MEKTVATFEEGWISGQLAGRSLEEASITELVILSSKAGQKAAIEYEGYVHYDKIRDEAARDQSYDLLRKINSVRSLLYCEAKRRDEAKA